MLPTTCISLKSIDSTNSFARRNLREFDPTHITIISADEQTQGKGRNTNKWSSPLGENLYATFAFAYQNSPFLLAQIAALATFDTLNSFGVKTRIKWPNDLITDKGKLSGVLIEYAQEEIGWAIVGIGINVLMKSAPKGLTRAASSIYLETHQEVAVAKVLEKLSLELQKQLQESSIHIQTQWQNQVIWMVGNRFPIKIDGTVEEALIESISPEGFLTCRTASGKKTISSAEIF